MAETVLSVGAYLQAAEVASLKHEVERQKDLLSSAELQAKFHQSRLKEEEDRHKVRFCRRYSFIQHRFHCIIIEQKLEYEFLSNL